MISGRAKELMTEDLERSDNRCPELHNMYIYNGACLCDVFKCFIFMYTFIARLSRIRGA